MGFLTTFAKNIIINRCFVLGKGVTGVGKSYQKTYWNYLRKRTGKGNLILRCKASQSTSGVVGLQHA